MMAGEIVNLRLVRRRRRRAEAAAEADANRLRSSVPGRERRAEEARKSLQDRRHEGHRLSDPDPDRT